MIIIIIIVIIIIIIIVIIIIKTKDVGHLEILIPPMPEQKCYETRF